jgi:hypothetical protein
MSSHASAGTLSALLLAGLLAARSPTYYGDAWAALGPALLDGAIDPCSEPADG